MMKFEGDQDFVQEPAILWSKLRSAAFLVECIPDATIEGQPTQEQAKCSVRPGLSFVRGSMAVDVKIIEAVEPTLVKVSLISKGIGSGSDVETIMNLAPHDPGTRVHWTAELKSLSGLMKMIPSGLIKGAAQKIIEEVMTGVKKKLT